MCNKQTCEAQLLFISIVDWITTCSQQQQTKGLSGARLLTMNLQFTGPVTQCNEHKWLTRSSNVYRCEVSQAFPLSICILKEINYWRWWRLCTQVTSCIFHFTLQRIGYLAATQSFHEGLDVVMLTTNMIRKDISTHNQYDASLALNGLACFMTPDLARWALIGTTSKCRTLRALPEATSNWRV